MLFAAAHESAVGRLCWKTLQLRRRLLADSVAVL